MSFYVYGTYDITPISLKTIVHLATQGRIDDALLTWKQHHNAAGRCVCGKNDFDPVCCGFCLVGKLMYLELVHSNASRGVDYLQTARTVSRFVQNTSATAAAGEEFYQPSAA
jgi:hypothetical protein